MTAGQIGSLILLLGLVAVPAWIVFHLIPASAADRMLLQLSEIRSVLDEMVASEPDAGRNPGVQRLRDHLQKLLVIGRPIGLSTLVPTTLMLRRNAGKVVRRRPTFEGLNPTEARLLGVLERWMVRETIRGTLLASRLWFVLLPCWLLARAALRERAQPLASSETEVDADDVVMASIDVYGRMGGGGTLVPA